MSALHQELITREMSDFKDPEEYFLRLEELQQQLKELKVTVEDATLKGIVTAKMPQRYQPLRAVIDTMGDVSYDKLKEHVRAFYVRNIMGAADTEKGEERAFTAAFKGKCFGCGEKGHKASVCKKKNGGGQKQGIKCYVCGVTGHYATECPDRVDKSQAHTAAEDSLAF
jgi:hypothetical protein